jgi:transcriptional regulator with XRE-family HTH domain
MSSFSRWLERKMSEENLNVVGLAAKLHVSHPTVSQWLNDASIPRHKNIAKLAELFRVPIEEVYQALGRIPTPDDEDLPPEVKQLMEITRSLPPEQRRLLYAMARELVREQERQRKQEEERESEASG